MADISAIKLPSGITYNLKDNGALQLTGGQVTGPVTFGDSISVDEATMGDLVVNGNASFTNNIQANTINGVAVGSSPQFTDTNTEVSTLTLLAGNTAGTSLTYGGKFTLTAGSKTVSFTMPVSDNTDEKLKTTEVTTATGYLIFGGNSSTAGTKNFSSSYQIDVNDSDGEAVLKVGKTNSIDGGLGLYNTNSGLTYLWANSAGTGSHIYLPSQPGTLALTGSTTSSSTTGLSIADHGTTSVGSASGWSAGTASSWAFEEVSIPNVTAAGSASSWTFEEKSIPNVTSAGSASTWAFTGVTVANSISGAVDSTDNTQLNITLGTTTVQSKSSGGNGTAPTLGTAIKVQSKSGGSNGSAPTLGTAIKVQSKKSGSNSTVPSLTITSTTVVNGKTHSITDNGHTHTNG